LEGSNNHKINKGDLMPRIIVTTDPSDRADGPTLLVLDERVYPVHLASDHSAAQLIERLGWAISDAENTERAELTL
jgi:hypothetical protein